jgi:biuret amidohydrolase
MQYGYNTVLIEDCCFSTDIEQHRAALVTLRVLCTAVVTGHDFITLLQRPQLPTA